MLLEDESARAFSDLVKALKEGPVTAYIGAGLSASMQPTWTALHAELQRESGLTPLRAFDPQFAAADFADFRNAMSEDQYLRVLRRRFGGVVTDYPELYRVIDETLGFKQLVTTNYDEFLASVAVSNNSQPDIVVYPNFDDIGARYVYLHGRAETASTPEDLVVTEADYGRAYEAPGHARDILKALFNRPGVFIGSSLQDPDLLHLIRQRARLLSTIGADSFRQLFAIVPVTPSADRGETLRDAVEIMTRRLRQLSVRAICYAKDENHTQLRAVLLQMQHEAHRRPLDILFLDRTRKLNHFGSLQVPTSDDIAQVQALIRGIPELAQHFFQHSATSLAWYEALKESVIIPGVMDPWEFERGKLRIGPWAAAPYIVRIAPHCPDVVVELIQRLASTRNWHAQSTLARLALELNDDHLQTALPVLTSWLDEPSGSLSGLDWMLAGLPQKLVERGALAIAFELTAQLLSLQHNEAVAGQQSLRIHEHWLPELRPVIKRMADQESKETYRFLKERLIQLMQLGNQRSQDQGWWRAAIEDHEQNYTGLYVPLHFLLEEARDALIAWAEQAPGEASKEIQLLLDSNSSLLIRLALHVVTVQPGLIPLLGQPVVNEDTFNEFDRFHELAVLLNKHFDALDEGSKELVHGFLDKGPERRSSETDEEWGQYLDQYRWQWLSLLPDEHWTPQERSLWADLQTTQQPLTHPDFNIWHGSLEIIEVEPGDAQLDDLRVTWQEGGASAVIELLRSKDGSWASLPDLIREDPDGLLELAPQLGIEDGERLASYFSGYAGVLDAQEAPNLFQWAPVLELMERLAFADPSQMPWTSGEFARLIDRGVTSEYNPIPPETLDRALDVTARLVEVFAKPLTTDVEGDGLIGLHNQLNSAAGKAANGFMRCTWQQLYLGKETPRQLPEKSRPKIKAATEQGWGGIEMRHALGEFWRVLEWGEPDWLSHNLEKLWPPDGTTTSVNTRRAFLLGFLQSATWSRNALRTLQPVFVDCIRDLGEDDLMYLTGQMLTIPFVRQLALGWLYEIEGYRFDGLFRDFAAYAPDSVRAEFVRQLGQLYRLGDAGDEPDFPGTETRRERYWLQRVSDREASLPIAEPSAELGAFLDWEVPLGKKLRQLESRLNVSIDHLPEGRASHGLLRIIAGRAHEEPLPAIRLLLRLFDRLLMERKLYLWGHSAELDAALTAICQGARPAHRRELRQVADRLMRAGLVDLSTKVQGCARSA